MRQYDVANSKTSKLKAVYCNKCKKELKITRGILEEDVYQGEKEWGFFSNKDGQIQGFDLCEACYDELVSGFQIPIINRRNKEFLG